MASYELIDREEVDRYDLDAYDAAEKLIEKISGDPAAGRKALTSDTNRRQAAATRAVKNGEDGRANERAEAWAKWRLAQLKISLPDPATLCLHGIDDKLTICRARRVPGDWVPVDDPTAPYVRRSNSYTHQYATRTEGRGKNKRRLVWIPDHTEYEPALDMQIPEWCQPVRDADLFHLAHQSGKTPKQALNFGNFAYGSKRAVLEHAAMPSDVWDFQQANDLLDHQARERRYETMLPGDPGAPWWRADHTALRELEAMHDMGFVVTHPLDADDDSAWSRESDTLPDEPLAFAEAA